MSEILRRTLGEGTSFETVLGAGAWLTKIDVGQLENALLNLAVNARDAMPAGGLLTIETSNTYLDDLYVSQLGLSVAPGQYVCVAVTDSGCGMDAATLDRVFEPFFTTKAVGQGTGLGLSQVYGFVRQSGGTVKMYSEVGRGTTVKIYLPRHVSSGAEQEQITTHSEYPIGQGECILLVEDNTLVRQHTREALEELGYHVCEAGDSQAALAIIGSNARVQLLFTDLVLPGGMTGTQLAERVLTLRPEIKVLFTTGYSRNAIVHGEQIPRASAFISKPYTLPNLAREIRGALGLD